MTVLSVNTMESNDSMPQVSNEPEPLDLSDQSLQDAVNILIAHEHALCQGDEDSADELLADLEPLLRRLNWAQNEWLRGLSGDLHMLNNEEVSEDNPYPIPKYWSLMAEAWINIENDPNQFLQLLRFKQDRFSSAKVAYARGRAYYILGFLTVATVFMRAASELNPQQSIYKMALMDLLNRQKRFDELDRALKEILDDPTISPELVIIAISISFNRAVKASEDVTRLLLGELRQKLQRVFDQRPLETFDPRTAVMGLHTLGSIQDRLNRPKKAQKLYRQALQIAPQDQAVRVSLALSLLTHNEQEALQLFYHVAAEGTPFEIAYLFAAKYTGEQGLFAESAAMAEKAIATTENVQVHAYAYEFLAVSEAELNGPTEKAQKYFSEALRLAPDDVNIQRNYRAFQAELSKAKPLSVHERQSTPELLSREQLRLDTNFIESLKFSLQPNEAGITRTLVEGFKNLNSQTTEGLKNQLGFAHAA